jgi:hypothetical protein
VKWGWLKPVGKWIGKALINAGRERIEEIIDEKKSARGAKPKAPKG